MSAPVIHIHDLTKYYGKARGIEKVNLQVDEGEIFGFIGPNGAGKSTTIRILLNLIFPSSGYSKILDMDVALHHHTIMQHVGYVPSDANAYTNLKVYDFLLYCSKFYKNGPYEKRINELAGCFELDLHRKISELSFGNRKKVSIVQSLIHKPKLLILDEPTSGLDPLMQAMFFDILQKENQKGMTIFFSSHLLNEVQKLCKRVAIIKEGRVIGVEEIEILRKKQLRKISIEFEEKTDLIDFKEREFAGDITFVDNSIFFMFSGDINQLTRILSEKRLKHLTIEEPTLEEIFMHYYN